MCWCAGSPSHSYTWPIVVHNAGLRHPPGLKQGTLSRQGLSWRFKNGSRKNFSVFAGTGKQRGQRTLQLKDTFSLRRVKIDNPYGNWLVFIRTYKRYVVFVSTWRQYGFLWKRCFVKTFTLQIENVWKCHLICMGGEWKQELLRMRLCVTSLRHA